MSTVNKPNASLMGYSNNALKKNKTRMASPPITAYNHSTPSRFDGRSTARQGHP
jgi:hypothetical protein